MTRRLIAGAPLPARNLRRVSKPRVVARTPAGRAVTRQKLVVLAELATWPNGQGAVAGALDGGSLAALVQLGLAERTLSDQIGGQRYRVTGAGQQLLDQVLRSK